MAMEYCQDSSLKKVIKDINLSVEKDQRDVEIRSEFLR